MDHVLVGEEGSDPTRRGPLANLTETPRTSMGVEQGSVPTARVGGAVDGGSGRGIVAM